MNIYDDNTYNNIKWYGRYITNMLGYTQQMLLIQIRFVIIHIHDLLLEERLIQNPRENEELSRRRFVIALHQTLQAPNDMMHFMRFR